MKEGIIGNGGIEGRLVGGRAGRLRQKDSTDNTCWEHTYITHTHTRTRACTHAHTHTHTQTTHICTHAHTTLVQFVLAVQCRWCIYLCIKICDLLFNGKVLTVIHRGKRGFEEHGGSQLTREKGTHRFVGICLFFLVHIQ